jgi:putative methionine-R-sulfoxide reductase with GAF domain
LKLLGDVEERARRMAVVSKAVQMAASEETLPMLIDQICDFTVAALAPDGCSIQLCTDERSSLEVAAARGYGRNITGMRVPRDCGVPGLAMATRRPTVSPNMADSKAPKRTPFASDYLSELAVPLVYRSQVLGVLHLGHRHAGMFDEIDLLNATILADCAAACIGGQRAMADATDDASYRDAQRSLLVSTIGGIVRCRDFSEVFSEVFPETAAFLRLARAAVLMPTSDGKALEVKYLFGYPEEISRKRLSLASSLPGEAYRRSDTVFTTDSEEQSACLLGQSALRVQMATPLKNNDKILGVLFVESEHSLVQMDIALLETVSGSLSGALERELLKDGLRENLETLAAVSRGTGAINKNDC